MSNTRVWLFRVLILAAAGLMLYSWFMPWWSCDIWALMDDAVIIHPWGLSISHDVGEYVSYIAGAEMPAWFAPLMWAYLGICIVALSFSLFAKEKAVSLGKFNFSLPQVIIGVIGLSYIVIVVLAVIIAAIRTGDYFDTPLQGYMFISIGRWVESSGYSSLKLGYWLACAVGPLCIGLALLRDKIIGKGKIIL